MRIPTRISLVLVRLGRHGRYGNLPGRFGHDLTPPLVQLNDGFF